MQICKTKITSQNFLILIILAIAVVYVYKAGSNTYTPKTDIKIENGKQIVRLVAKGGYSPLELEVASGMPIKLQVETKNTFDCSSAFQIPDLKINTTLPPTGTTEFDIPPLLPGQTIQGNCNMYMYRFKIKAS